MPKKDNFQDISSYENKKNYKKKNKFLGLKIFLIVFSIFIMFIGGACLYVANYLLGDLTTTTISKDNVDLGISTDAVEHDKVTNIALFGVDARDDDYSGRSDTIMVLSVDEIHGKLKLTSILRDVRVEIGEECPTSTGFDKLNHSYAYGGPELAIKTINSNFDLDIKDYVTVNFSDLAGIVDAFGGVDIEVTSAEVAEINKNLQGQIAIGSGTENDYIADGSSGVLHLNGPQALAYSRIRHIGNDDGRAERQQNVLEAIMNNASNLSASDYPNLIKQMSSMCETSLDFAQILALAPIATTDFSVERIVVPNDLEELDIDSGTGENGGWMWFYDTHHAGELIGKFIYEDEYEQLKP